METKLSLSDYRKKARASLAQQWGINAWASLSFDVCCGFDPNVF